MVKYEYLTLRADIDEQDEGGNIVSLVVVDPTHIGDIHKNAVVDANAFAAETGWELLSVFYYQSPSFLTVANPKLYATFQRMLPTEKDA